MQAGVASSFGREPWSHGVPDLAAHRRDTENRQAGKLPDEKIENLRTANFSHNTHQYLTVQHFPAKR
jgi:hypothetical protein